MSRYDLTYQLTPELQSRAMVSWAKPQRTRTQMLRRLVLGLLVYLVLVAATVAVLQMEILTPALVIAAAVGFLIGMAFWAAIHQYNMKKLTGFANDALARQGQVRAVFAPSDVELTTAISTGRMQWSCFDQVLVLRDATVLRAGALVYAVPDAALPQDVTPTQFRADLTQWMAGQ